MLGTIIKELIRYFYGRIQLNLNQTRVDEKVTRSYYKYECNGEHIVIALYHLENMQHC
jgi:hypothetical protein